MFRCLKVVFAVALISVVSMLAGTQTGLASASFNVSDDPGTGRVSVENDLYKAIWNYKTDPARSNNQSGGNLYGLYYKPTDPLQSNNLISVANQGNGNAVICSGVGGSGQTRMYAADSPPPASSNYSFGDLIGDNNLSGTLLDHHIQQNSDGSVSITFTYDVRNQATGVSWYRAEKQWVVYPDGHLTLTINRQFLRSGYISEPGTSFLWDKAGGGWTRFEKYGHGWSEDSSQDRMVSIQGIDTVNEKTWDSLNQFYPLWTRMAGSATAPDITVTAVGGFESSGLFGLGQTAWNGSSGATMEQNVFGNSLVTTYGMIWTGWWGGNPPNGSRYKFVSAPTAISDIYQITLGGEPQEMSGLPRISDISISNIDSGGATFSWTTDVPAESTVRYAPTNQWREQVATAPGLSTTHSVRVTNLGPNTVYRYNVGTSSSVAVGGSGEFSTSATTDLHLSLSLSTVYWASYQDYLDRVVSAQFSVLNQGSSNAAIVDIVRDSSSASVTSVNMPVHVGSLPGGTNDTFEVRYLVPAGVQSFRTFLYGIATDASGLQHPFP